MKKFGGVKQNLLCFGWSLADGVAKLCLELVELDKGERDTAVDGGDEETGPNHADSQRHRARLRDHPPAQGEVHGEQGSQDPPNKEPDKGKQNGKRRVQDALHRRP